MAQTSLIAVDHQAMQRKLKFQKEEMQRKLGSLWYNTKERNNFTIFRTPHSISQSKKNLFEPSVISIGPFHRGRKHLRTMEEKKWRFFQDFLSRGDHISLDLCISEMNLLEERTRRCYSESFDHLHSNAFVEMMLLDGCFVLEYFLQLYIEKLHYITEVGWNFMFIDRDLLLLENQIPFFIVEKLHEIGLKQRDKNDFVKCLFHMFRFRDLFNNPINYTNPDHPAKILHLVHLCYHYIVPIPGIPVVLSSKPFYQTRMFSANRIKGLIHWFRSRVLRGRSPHSTSRSSNSTENISFTSIPSATELQQKGLKFTKKSNPEHMFDISFEYGVLKIPRLVITDYTKPILTNFMAFEHSPYGKEGFPFTSYVVFLDNLVHTPNDVTILQECGIIENRLGSEEQVANFLNQLTEGRIVRNDHFLAVLFTEVNRYIGSSWHRNRAKFIRDYFSSPWKAISLIAAFILVVLTLVQSFFAVYAYFVPPSS